VEEVHHGRPDLPIRPRSRYVQITSPLHALVANQP
jgi:hypothetical protein